MFLTGLHLSPSEQEQSTFSFLFETNKGKRLRSNLFCDNDGHLSSSTDQIWFNSNVVKSINEEE